MPFVVGESVGPYRIVEQLGQGGMATVFKAYHAALDRYVAIKAMHPAFMEDPNFLARFQREAQVVAKLEHPNIVPIYDFAEHQGRPYLVMKFIEGETLKARLSRSPIQKEEVLQIVEHVGAALAYAHDHGILHRDIKPSNVLLAGNRQVFLADFGLARIAEAGQSTLSTDVMLGTPQYISPEQAMGKRDLNVGTDIYSFAVMLYEMVVGRVPFSADTPYSIIHDHIYTPLPLPRTINPDVPEIVERVLLKALAKDPADRYPEINQLSSAFAQAINGEPVPDVTLLEGMDPTVVLAPDDPHPPVDDVLPSEPIPAASLSATLPEREVVPPSPEVIPPAAEAIPSTPEDVPTSSEVIPSATELIPPTEAAIPSVPEDVPISSEVIPSATELIPPTEAAIPSMPEDVPISSEVIPPTAESIPSTPAGIPTPPEILPPIPESMVTTPDDLEPVEKRRFTWRRWYFVPLVLGLCFCGLLGLSIIGENRGGGGVGEFEPPGASQGGEEPRPIPEGALAEAEHAVSDNPDDPFAHLEFAMALLDAERLEGAQKELEVAEELAGGENIDFYLAAGEMLAQNERWFFAALVYLRLVNNFPGDLPPDVVEQVEYAVYQASEDEGARSMFVAGERMKGINPLLVETARARFQLYHGRIEMAQNIVEELLRREPEYRPAQLVQAEILFGFEQDDQAIEIVNRLVEEEAPPFWVTEVARFIQEEFRR